MTRRHHHKIIRTTASPIREGMVVVGVVVVGLFLQLVQGAEIRLAEGVDRQPSPPASESQASLQSPKRSG